MTYRRTFISVAVAFLSTTAGCLYFRPIDPNPPRVREPLPQSESTPVSEPQPTSPAVSAPQPTSPPVSAPPPVSPPVSAPQPVSPPVTTPQPSVPPVAAPQPTTPPESTPQTQFMTPAPLPKPAPRRGTLGDANIAAMVLALNNTDISYARLVPARAQRDDVIKFADRMLTDHTGVNGLVTDLLRKLDLAAVDNITSLDLRDESAHNRDILRELSGFAFDSTYMENEVSYHRKFLTTIDNDMLPSARNAELRSLLVSIRPAVAAHLAHAEQTRANVLAKK